MFRGRLHNVTEKTNKQTYCNSFTRYYDFFFTGKKNCKMKMRFLLGSTSISVVQQYLIYNGILSHFTSIKKKNL